MSLILANRNRLENRNKNKADSQNRKGRKGNKASYHQLVSGKRLAESSVDVPAGCLAGVWPANQAGQRPALQTQADIGLLVRTEVHPGA